MNNDNLPEVSGMGLPPLLIDERTCQDEGEEMVNQAHLRTRYATTRCALMQSQFEFQWLLRDFLSLRRRRRATQEETQGLRLTLENKRRRLRMQLQDLARISEEAKVFPGLMDRAIADSHRLFEERIL